MRELYELKDKLCGELKSYAKKDISASSLTMIDTLAHSLKNIDKIIEKCEEEEGYSNGSMGGSYGYSRRYSMDGSYARRRRDSMGRYSRDGYSGDDDVTMDLQDLMKNAPDERTRKKIQSVIERMENM
jgi:hypothetical protein